MLTHKPYFSTQKIQNLKKNPNIQLHLHFIKKDTYFSIICFIFQYWGLSQSLMRVKHMLYY